MLSQEWINTIIYGAGFLLLFGAAEILFHVFKVKGEITRKIVHAGTGLITMSFPIFLTKHWSVLILSSAFLILLASSKRLNILNSINDIDRFSLGSELYPIIIYINFLIYLYFDDVLFFYLPILILAICDPIAALCGKRWPIRPFRVRDTTKTVMGSACFFLSCVILSFSFVVPLRTHWVEIVSVTIFISLMATLSEALSQKGWDNLFIPLVVIVSLLLSEYMFHF